MKLLALDIATKTGWKTETSSGVWDFKLKRGESYGMRVVKFNSAVRELIELEKIDIICYERPAGRFAASVMCASEMVGVLNLICNEKGIELTTVSAKEIKSYATGNGNSGKPAMIQAAKDKYPNIKIIDDNHADAIFIYDLTKEDLKL